MRFVRVAMSFVAAVCLLLSMTTRSVAQPGPEQPDVKIAIGGTTFLQFLPVMLADRLGYFKDEGINLRIVDVQGGARALESLMAGAVDVTAGSFDHTIQMQAKRRPIVGLVLFSRFPGIVIGVRTDLADRYTGPASLKGMTIGVSSPGSQTNFAVSYMMIRAGLQASDASYFGVGAGSGAIAAIQQKQIDAISNADPVMTKLADAGQVRIVVDTRTAEGNDAAFGGPYPSGAIYSNRAFIEKNPRTVQALVNAVARALAWIQAATPEQIAAAMPPEFSLGDPALYLQSIRNSRAIWSPDGRFTMQGAEVSLRVLQTLDPSLQGVTIDLQSAFTNQYVDRAGQTHR